MARFGKELIQDVNLMLATDSDNNYQQGTLLGTIERDEKLFAMLDPFYIFSTAHIRQKGRYAPGLGLTPSGFQYATISKAYLKSLIDEHSSVRRHFDDKLHIVLSCIQCGTSNNDTELFACGVCKNMNEIWCGDKCAGLSNHKCK